ncbi:hypothetical protein [Vallitalea maricola]|uniref:Uncharacterized protein n=1 Tax=Vallitalea maricola TaxID=3074433 RepID=A0ACB5UPB7_9FIRM|nr:hypothetical protein AN2V17_38590 [Vallitalea sp. AN17-2]
MYLYRPVGLKEFILIKDSGYTQFPPRLFHQPIFYPVLNEEYAIEIASNWNTKDAISDFIGIVLKFEIDDSYVSKFKVEVVGGNIHQEMWVPAEELNEFNIHIIGEIQVSKTFYGDKYQGKTIEELLGNR